MADSTRSIQSEGAIVAQALGMAAMGHSTRQIQDEVGVDSSTVSRWTRRDDLHQKYSEEIAQYISIEGDSLTAKWTRINHRIADEILDGEREVTVQQAMVAFGIGRDKTVQAKGGPLNPQGITINFNVPPNVSITEVTE